MTASLLGNRNTGDLKPEIVARLRGAGCNAGCDGALGCACAAVILAADEIERLRAQRDYLLAAAREVHSCGNGGAKLSRKASDMIRAAISKALSE
jgi:hypothetical protein